MSTPTPGLMELTSTHSLQCVHPQPTQASSDGDPGQYCLVLPIHPGQMSSVYVDRSTCIGSEHGATPGQCVTLNTADGCISGNHDINKILNKLIKHSKFFL